MQINHDRRRSFVDNIRTYNDWGDDFPDAKAILRGVRHPFIWKKGLWYGITTSCGKDVIMYILSSREMRQKFYQNNDLKLLGLAGSMKEAYEIVLKLVQMGYNSDCIYEMNDYLEKF